MARAPALAAAILPGTWVAVALGVRVIVAARTPIPARDAATYLWMAEQVAAGRIGAAFETVFHPLYPLLVAAVHLVAPGLSWVAAGQVVGALCGALAAAPLVALGRRLYGAEAGAAAGLLYAAGIWFARHPADCLSEGPFYLLVASTLWLLATGPRAVLAGITAALAYGTRPEGVALVVLGLPWLWWQGAARSALRLGLGFAAVAWLWPVGWALLGPGLTVTPKLAFNYTVGIGAAADPLLHYLRHLVQIPGEAFEALGYIATPLIAVGVLRAWPLSRRSPAVLILALAALQVAVIPLLRSHFRFLSGYGMPLLVLAGLAVRDLRRYWVHWPRPAWIALALLAVAGDLVRLPQARRTDRLVLRQLGEYLGAQLGTGETIATAMPRLEYFAGLRPGPPRPIAPAEILQACKSPATRYAVVVVPGSGVAAADLRQLGLRPVALPAALRAATAARGMLVYERGLR